MAIEKFLKNFNWGNDYGIILKSTQKCIEPRSNYNIYTQKYQEENIPQR